MRTEKEMYDLIINTAKEDDRIRAVYMNGSRTNPNAPKDIFQDYDIVYVVTENKPFIQDRHWIDRFGERLYMQMPDELDTWFGKKCDFDQCYGWLIQFADGNRLDLHIEPVGHEDILEDKLCRILLDKDHILPDIPESTDEDYHVRKPNENEYKAVCNEFWWCLNNVAKGLWRNEIPYAMDMQNYIVRPQLISMLSWKVGLTTEFTVSVGKSGKYMNRWLPDDIWNDFLKTYPAGNTEAIWNSVFVMCRLFEKTAKEVAGQLNFIYNEEEGKASLSYLRHVSKLPKDAKEVYPGI